MTVTSAGTEAVREKRSPLWRPTEQQHRFEKSCDSQKSFLRSVEKARPAV